MIGREIVRRASQPAAASLLVVATVVWTISLVAFGPPAPLVCVVWSDTGSGARHYLERRFSLTDGREVADGKWEYALRDTSRDNRRALATNAGVTGVEGIDARTFEVAGLLPRAAWRRGWVPVPESLARAAELVAIAAALAGVALLWAPAAVATAAGRSRAAAAAAGRWLQRGIPECSPEAAAAFRIVFGSLVVAFFLSEPVYPGLLTSFELARAGGLYGAAVRWLAERPDVVTMIRPAIAVTGALFVTGIATRVSFACFTAAALTWTTVFTLNISSHATASLVMTLLVLLAAPWGDAWSVDAWLRRSRGRARPAPSRAYGYAFWAPGFVLALAFAAAAWSKVREGPAWILNGTVKYHFVSDLEHAWVSWGPVLTQWHAIAVALAAFAVVAEALLITAMFSRSYAYRAMLGCSAVVLLAGFALFQGIVWFGWWILLAAFLPWHLVRRGHQDVQHSRAIRIAVPQLAAIGLLVVQQLVASAMRIEARPMFSAYDMYSTTYASPDEYEAASNLVYRVVAVAGGRSTDLPGCIVDDRVAAIARRALEGSEGDMRLLQSALEGCLRSAHDVRQLALEGDRQVFLWDESRFAWKRRLDVIGPIEARLLRQ